MRTSLPFVSVVLPVHNREATVRRAAGSVLGQDFDDLELIVVDDASSDGTLAVLAGVTDSRLHVVALAENGGPAAARNAGAAVARGGILAFQDSDDVWMPGHLRQQVERLGPSRSDVAVSYGRLRKVLAGGGSMLHPGRDQRQLEGDLFRALSRGNFVGLPAAVVRLEAFRAVGGFDERLRCLEDWDLWLRLAARYRFGFVDDVVVESPTSTDGVNDAAENIVPALMLIGREHAASLDSLARANLAYLRADALMRRGRVAEARRGFLGAIGEDPRHGKSWLALAAATAGRGSYLRMKSVAARARHGA